MHVSHERLTTPIQDRFMILQAVGDSVTTARQLLANFHRVQGVAILDQTV